MFQIAWFMGARATPLEIGALPGMSSEKPWQFVQDLNRHGTGQFIFSKSEWDTLGKRYMVMKFLAESFQLMSVHLTLQP